MCLILQRDMQRDMPPEKRDIRPKIGTLAPGHLARAPPYGGLSRCPLAGHQGGHTRSGQGHPGPRPVRPRPALRWCFDMKIQTRLGRPLGEVSQALLSAARQGPAPMATLAMRAQVGYDVARFKVPALARCGALVALNDERPRVYALPGQSSQHDAFVLLCECFWGSSDGA
jgi:hypothetical protein